MKVMTEVLENELKTAFEVKDENAVHRYVSLMLEQSMEKKENEAEHSEFKKALLSMDAKTDDILIETREGFKRMDERFETANKLMDERFGATNKQMDERFKSVDKRFTMMFAFMSIGFVIVSTLVTVYQFLD